MKKVKGWRAGESLDYPRAMNLCMSWTLQELRFIDTQRPEQESGALRRAGA